MNPVFKAESVVVVGVSEAIDNLGKNVVANLVNFGYRGTIYAVGPRGGEIFGRPIYRSIQELPGSAELAVILTPARLVSEMLEACGEKGVRWAVIETAGFEESGLVTGVALEREIMATCRKFGIHFVGPNCVGTADTASNLYTPFMLFAAPLRRGKIGVFAQSGGVGLSMAERVCRCGLGVSKFVSMGNKLDRDEVDYLAFAMDDPETEIIYLYLEGFKRGREFAELARRCEKPIVLHKSNTSAASLTIAHSHTAVLAADDQVVGAMCRECSIIRVHSLSEALGVLKGLSLPHLKGTNLAVISRSGGHAVVIADACTAWGFGLPPLESPIIDLAKSRARADVICLGNPLDLGDIYDLPLYSQLVEKVLQQDNIDGVVFMLVSQMMSEGQASRELLEKLSELSRKFGKPVATVVEIPFEERVRLEQNSNTPFFLDPVEAVEALAVQVRGRKTTPEAIAPPKPPEDGDTEKIEKWFVRIRAKNRQPLLHDALELIDICGVPAVPWRMARDLESGLEASRALGFPVALKAVAPSLLHKSDKGAIALDVCDADSLRSEWRRLEKISGDIAGIVVQKMVPTARELVIGGKNDPSFGPVVLTGLGGIMVEVLKDISIRLAPVDVQGAMEMLSELSGSRILGRFRGMREADLEAAAGILSKISLLISRFPQIREIDINPVSLGDSGEGALALDARLLIDLD
ncbi:MAG: acetate--CoA ligase family protein [Syntrophobacteraceae bacterium]|nr:acetate--CoA ligase family protein [Syntrophobacteraceae bacterium]